MVFKYLQDVIKSYGNPNNFSFCCSVILLTLLGSFCCSVILLTLLGSFCCSVILLTLLGSFCCSVILLTLLGSFCCSVILLTLLGSFCCSVILLTLLGSFCCSVILLTLLGSFCCSVILLTLLGSFCCSVILLTLLGSFCCSVILLTLLGSFCCSVILLTLLGSFCCSVILLTLLGSFCCSVILLTLLGSFCCSVILLTLPSRWFSCQQFFTVHVICRPTLLICMHKTGLVFLRALITSSIMRELCRVFVMIPISSEIYFIQRLQCTIASQKHIRHTNLKAFLSTDKFLLWSDFLFATKGFNIRGELIHSREMQLCQQTLSLSKGISSKSKQFPPRGTSFSSEVDTFF